jgi:protein O-mannosyl-transferase
LKQILAYIAATVGAAILVLALYSPARTMSFYFDDRVTVLQNEKVQSNSPFTAFWENPFRGVVNLSFWAQLQLHRPHLPAEARDLKTAVPNISRKYDPFYRRDFAYYQGPATNASIPVSLDPERGLVFALPPALPFRLFNLALHLANAVLLLFILRRLAPSAPAAAAIAAFAFMVSPLATEPVNYITARFGLMATAFSLAAILLHLAADDKPKRDYWALGFFVLALMCKETAAALPLIVFILDLARGRPGWRALWPLPLSILYTLLRSQWQIELGPAGGEILPWHLYLLMQQRVVWLYALKALMPAHLNFENHLITSPLLDAPFALVNASLLGCSLYLLGRSWRALTAGAPVEPGLAAGKDLKRNKAQRGKGEDGGKVGRAKDAGPISPAALRWEGPWWRWAAAMIVMVGLALAPTSSVLPLSDLVREERAYPLLLVLIPALLLGMAPRLAQMVPTASRRGVYLLLAIFFISMSGLTYARNRAWSSELALARDAAAKAPFNPRATYNYAVALRWSERYSDAISWSQRTYGLDPNRTEALRNIEAIQAELTKRNP